MVKQPTKRDWMEIRHISRRSWPSHARCDTLETQLEDRDRKIMILKRNLGFYENPNTPPSQNSIQWKK